MHDTAMGRMNYIGNLQTKLQQENAELDSSEVAGAYSELQVAREAMMNWMREFEVPAESTEEEQRAYLKAENDRIKQVDQTMLKAIDKAEKLLEAKALD